MPNSNSAMVRPSRAGRRSVIGELKQYLGGSRVLAQRTRMQRAVIEGLEDRQLMSVVYISSSSGSDKNPGTSARPVATIAKAYNMARSGDTVLLKAGDAWNTGMGYWSKSNTTIGSYGTGARPKIRTANDGLAIIRASNITVRGISFNGLNGTSRNGIVTTGGNGNIKIENCEVTGFRMNITAQGYYGPIKGLSITNCLITRSNGIGMSSGLYADNVHGLTITNSIFDRNGGTGSMYNHGAYITALCSGLRVTGCTFSYSSNFGMQARCGGVISNNTFKCNSVGLSVGIVNGGGVHTPGGVVANVTNNLFTGVGVGLHAGYGMDLGNIKSGLVSGNRFVNGTGYRYAATISLSRGTASGDQVGIRNLTISNNSASNWGSRTIQIAKNAGLVNVTIVNNNL